MKNQVGGFTLIEVLLSLVIVAIAFTALLKATGTNIVGTRQIRDKTVSHLVAMQGIDMIQLGMVATSSGQDITEMTNMLSESWYWRVHQDPTPVKSMKKLTVRTSKKISGPFTGGLCAFRHAHE